MPGMDGVEVARQLTGMTLRHRPPAVLMVTAFSRDEARRRATEAAAPVAAMLAKPVTPSTLLDACLDVLLPSRPGSTTLQSEDATLARQRLSLAGARLLLVEDNPVNQELACELLRRAGIEVVVADNGVRALRDAGAAGFRRRSDGLPDARTRWLRGHPATAPGRALGAVPGDRDDGQRDGWRSRQGSGGGNERPCLPSPSSSLSCSARWPAGYAPPAPHVLPADRSTKPPCAKAVWNLAVRSMVGCWRCLPSAAATSARGSKLRQATRSRRRAWPTTSSPRPPSLGACVLSAAAADLEAACVQNAADREIETQLDRVQAALAPVLHALHDWQPGASRLSAPGSNAVGVDAA